MRSLLGVTASRVGTARLQQPAHLRLRRHGIRAEQPRRDDRAGRVCEPHGLGRLCSRQQPVAESAAECVAGAEAAHDLDRDRLDSRPVVVRSPRARRRRRASRSRARSRAPAARPRPRRDRGCRRRPRTHGGCRPRPLPDRWRRRSRGSRRPRSARTSVGSRGRSRCGASAPVPRACARVAGPVSRPERHEPATQKISASRAAARCSSSSAISSSGADGSR